MITVSNCEDNNSWNEFLEKEKGSQMITIAHNPSLGPILSKTFGYKYQNLLLKNESKVVGVFPVTSIGNKIVSLPHFSYGGPIIDSDENIDVDLHSIFKGEKFEIRSFSKLSKYFNDEKISLVIKLHNSIDEQLMSVKSRFRNKIRKTEKMDFKIKIGGLELLDDFYAVFSRRMLQLGSPPLGKVFFKNIIDDYEFGEAEITVVYDNDKAVAVGFCLSYLNFNEMCWASSDFNYDKFNVNSLLYWNMIKTSIFKKHTYFSLGRSTVNSNNHHYKNQWNPMEIPVYYNYSVKRTTSIKKFVFLTKLWKLQPLKTSVYFGHFISKYVY